MKQYTVKKAIELSLIGKSGSLVHVGDVLVEENEYVQVDLTSGILTEVVILRNKNDEKFFLTCDIVNSLVLMGALKENP